MQLTLVSHYGPKPRRFVELIAQLQCCLTASLSAAFIPYAPEQVHGTIAGLEGTRTPRGIRNRNFARYRGEERDVDFQALLGFLRGRFEGFEIRVGGFAESTKCEFTSRGQAPFVRSFSLQGEIVVAMGWPWQGGRVTLLLDQLRRGFQQFGVLHKWHREPGDLDNDFFFVLGRISAGLSSEQRRAAERQLREHLANRQPCMIPVDRESLAFVAYTDTQLPPASSRVFRVTDPSVTPAVLERAWD